MAAFIDFKQINRHVLRRKLNQFIQRIAPAFRSLVRQSGNQVEADVLNSCGVKKGHRAIDITAACMRPAALSSTSEKIAHRS